jgi:hypothetical protein
MKQWNNPQWNFPAKVYVGLGFLLFFAAAPMPYGFYSFTKIVVCGLLGLLSYKNFNFLNEKNTIWPWFFLFLAILFNPFIPIPMGKEVWMVVDTVLGVFFLFLAYKAKKPEWQRQK